MMVTCLAELKENAFTGFRHETRVRYELHIMRYINLMEKKQRSCYHVQYAGNRWNTSRIKPRRTTTESVLSEWNTVLIKQLKLP